MSKPPVTLIASQSGDMGNMFIEVVEDAGAMFSHSSSNFVWAWDNGAGHTFTGSFSGPQFTYNGSNFPTGIMNEYLQGDNLATVFDLTNVNINLSKFAGIGITDFETIIFKGNDSITGSGDADTLEGFAGKDTIIGGAGGDHIHGDAGNDSIIGDAGQDNISGDAGNDTLLGGDDNDSLDGGIGNDTLFGENNDDAMQGGAGNDYLFGGAGNDTLDGGLGRDSLDGGTTGNDVFMFDTTVLSSNKDTIINWHAGDKIELNHNFFTALGVANPLDASHFVTGIDSHTAVASNASQFILYNSTTGTLYYDSDGNTAHGQHAIQIAVVDTVDSHSHPGLSHNDFVVV